MFKVLRGGRGSSASSKPEAASQADSDPLLPVARAAAMGDRQAIQTLLVCIGPSLLRSARAVLGANDPDVDDVAQEAAWGLITSLPRFQGRSTVTHYACRIAIQVALSVRRRRARAPIPIGGDPPTDSSVPATSTCSPVAETLRRERREQIRRLIEALPEAQAEALLLQAVFGHTVEEIAATANVSPNTIRSRLQLAKAALRRSPRVRLWTADVQDGDL